MGSSGGGGGGNPMALMGQNRPMPGLPIAGSGGIGDPYKYGQFQNFLPDIKAEGPNDMATGLRPEMFEYKKPGGGAVDAGGGAGGVGGDQLRDALAAMLQNGGGGRYRNDGMLGDIGMNNGVTDLWGGGGGGTMGMGGGGGGGGPFANGLAPPPGAQQLPTPAGGWVNPHMFGYQPPPQPAPQPGFGVDWRSKGEPLIKAPVNGVAAE